MYKIYYADMAKATGISEMGKRPVVSVGFVNGDKNKVKVYKITSRNRNDKFHVKINTYVVNGYCDISNLYIIDTKYLLNFKRDCTTSEINAIKKKTIWKNKKTTFEEN